MNSRLLIVAIILILAVGGVFLLNKNQKTPVSGNKLQVSTSFYPLYFFSSQIAGEKADVKNITPAGAEPHDYEPTSQDIARIETSSLLILNGGVEPWADKMKENLKGKNIEIVVAGEGLLNRDLNENGEMLKDPHVWLDPVLAKQEVEKIKLGFIKIDPNNASIYEANAKALDNKLDSLDSQFKNGLASCQKKDIITSHAAFGYLAARYNLNQVSISGLSPDEEPSTQALGDVANFARKNNIKYIFFESLVSPKLSETIASEVGANTLVLDPLEGLSEDKTGRDYFTVMQENLKNLQTALECKTT